MKLSTALTSWVVANCLDLATTLYLLSQHVGHEANPLGAFLLTHSGIPGFVGFKILGTLALVIYTLRLKKQQNPWAASSLMFASAIIWLAVINNTIGILVTR